RSVCARSARRASRTSRSASATATPGCWKSGPTCSRESRPCRSAGSRWCERTWGVDGIWLTEHNFTGESVYCDPIPFASVVAARTSRIRIGFAVIQLALRHPIRLATELALLDNLSGGRLDVGVGHGTNFNEYEFMGYGLRSDDSRERMAETLDVMGRAWKAAHLLQAGEFYQLRLPEPPPRPLHPP